MRTLLARLVALALAIACAACQGPEPAEEHAEEAGSPAEEEPVQATREFVESLEGLSAEERSAATREWFRSRKERMGPARGIRVVGTLREPGGTLYTGTAHWHVSQSHGSGGTTWGSHETEVIEGRFDASLGARGYNSGSPAEIEITRGAFASAMEPDGSGWRRGDVLLDPLVAARVLHPFQDPLPGDEYEFRLDLGEVAFELPPRVGRLTLAAHGEDGAVDLRIAYQGAWHHKSPPPTAFEVETGHEIDLYSWSESERWLGTVWDEGRGGVRRFELERGARRAVQLQPLRDIEMRLALPDLPARTTVAQFPAAEYEPYAPPEDDPLLAKFMRIGFASYGLDPPMAQPARVSYARDGRHEVWQMPLGDYVLEVWNDDVDAPAPTRVERITVTEDGPTSFVID